MTIATEHLPEIEEEISEFDGKAHHVRIQALMTGGVVVALCGKRWVPQVIAGAEKLPVCPTCKELMAIFEMLSDM